MIGSAGMGSVEQAGQFAEQFRDEVLAIQCETSNDLHRGGLFVGDFMQRAAVEGQDLRFGVAQQNGRVGGNDELRVRVVLQCVVNENQKCELPLRGERGLRLIQQEQAGAAELMVQD